MKSENERLKESLNNLVNQNSRYRPNNADNVLSSRSFLTKDQFSFFKEKSQVFNNDKKDLGPLPGIFNQVLKQIIDI